jgi:SAM-dependent methyltransferase
LNVDETAGNLEQGDHGIWFSKNRSEVSYPASGNDTCYAIEDGSFWFHHRNRCILASMRAYPPSGTLFDVGGGNGFVSLAIQRSGCDTVLVEPGIAGAVNARRRGLTSVICSTVEDADFRPHSLPAIGIFDVLEHIEGDLQFLRGLRELLLPSGRIYVTVPTYRWLWSADDVFAGHFRRYTLSSLVSTVVRAGFDVEFASYIFAVLPLPIFLARTLPSRLKVRDVATAHGGAREHLASLGWRKLLDGIFAWERKAIELQRSIPFGSSCLLIAKSN